MVKALMSGIVSMVKVVFVIAFASCTSSDATSQSFKNGIEKKVLRIAKKKELPSVAITIFHDGDFWDFQYTNEDVDIQEIYGIGSTTKLLAAVLVLKLVEEEKLSLKDSVNTYVTGLDHMINIQSVTIGDLLSHTSGLHDFTKHPSWIQRVINDKTPRTFGEKIELVDNQLNPRGVFEYSNTNYLVLEKVVESITGTNFIKVFNDFYADHNLSEIQLGRPDKEIQGFFARELETVANVSGWREYYGYAGEAYTTSMGLYKFSKALFIENSILNQESMNQLKEWISMGSNSIPIGSKGKIMDYGNGSMRLFYDGKEYVGHSGGTLKYQSFLFVNEKEKTSINIVTNCSGRYYNNVFFQEVIPAILEEL
ncbi:MAG: serine hydrolase domain-containing protein [Bacteroidota bacterium]